jgi:hypothetical protein
MCLHVRATCIALPPKISWKLPLHLTHVFALSFCAHTHTHSAQEVRADEYGVESVVPVLKPAPIAMYATQSVFVPAVLARTLRPHQREGVQFMYECVMGLKDFEGNGCILADGTCRAMFLIACVS